MKIPDGRNSEATHGSFRSSVTDPGLLRPFSELLAFLTGFNELTSEERQPGYLSLRLQSGTWALSLNDPQTGQYCYLNGTKLDDLLLMAEVGLGDGGLPWRASRAEQPKKAK